jgi:sulfite oxidase
MELRHTCRIEDAVPQSACPSNLILRTAEPLNAETPLSVLAESWITPQEHFFIRTHGDVPEINPAAHRLKVGGHVATPLELSLAGLQQNFPVHRTGAALLCAGNRREELNVVDAVAGTNWNQGAVGNAEWTGVRLVDILTRAGVASGDLHVIFTAADAVTVRGVETGFGASNPLSKAMSSEVLVDFAINVEALTPEHGFPLRVVVPGYIGARSVKWLTGIEVALEPSDNYCQQIDYKLLPVGMHADEAERGVGVMLGELPVNSAVLTPLEGAELKRGMNVVRGYAVAGSGRTVGRVDVSANGGRTWQKAELEGSGAWTWTLWKAEIDLAPGSTELVVRAWDSAAQTQPERLETVWNVKGYMNNALHRVAVTVR